MVRYLNSKDKSEEKAKELYDKCQCWSFDVWSLGICIVEIIAGCPLWMQIQSIITTAAGKECIRKGLFGKEGRELEDIQEMQADFLLDVRGKLEALDKYNITQNKDLMDLL